MQRVTAASVSVGGDVVGEIRPSGQGLLALVGVTHSDTDAVARRMAEKLWQLRILDDERSAADTRAPILVISQFTLYANTVKGAQTELERGGARIGRRTTRHGVRRCVAGVGCPRRNRGGVRRGYESLAGERRPPSRCCWSCDPPQLLQGLAFRFPNCQHGGQRHDCGDGHVNACGIGVAGAGGQPRHHVRCGAAEHGH